MAQVMAVRAAKMAGLDRLQALSGYGDVMEYETQRYLREVMCLAAFSGSEETLGSRLGVRLGL